MDRSTHSGCMEGIAAGGMTAARGLAVRDDASIVAIVEEDYTAPVS